MTATAAPVDRAMVIDGSDVETGEWHDVRSPYDGELVGRVAWGDAAHARRALDAAATAMATPLPQAERAEILERMARAVEQQNEELAATISAEAGKPITLARLEAQRTVGTLQAAAVAARTLAGQQVPIEGWASGAGHVAYTVRRPRGVVAAITPFNFPLNLVAHKVAPALAAGCAVVLKPADKTPLSALALSQIARDAGLPAGWLNVVVGPAADIADVLCEDERVGVLSFTGSQHVGMQLRSRARHARVLLELGNATPAIVLADADLDLAAAKLAATSFAFAGQACVSVQRILVEHAVTDAFAERFLHHAEQVRAGDPADERTQCGPVITSESHDRLLSWVDEAVAAGAQLRTGGTSLGNQVVAPTVLTELSPKSKLATAEAFGPVVGIAGVASLDAAIERANATPYGLQAAVFTRSLDASLDAIERLRFGSVMVNETPSFRADHMPYGGTKQSGNTKEGPSHAVLEMTDEQLVVIARGARADEKGAR